MKKYWPVPNCYKKFVAKKGTSAFRAYRWYGRHEGIDIWAPLGSRVVAIEDGKVVKTDWFTSPSTSNFRYRKTYYLMVQNDSRNVALYGEIRKPKLKVGKRVKAGQIIGYIGRVLRKKEIKSGESPYMLHFELYKKGTKNSSTWYNKKPKQLLNPTKYLELLLK